MRTEVLVVDDEKGYQDLLAYLLEPLKIRVTCVSDGDEALRQVRETNFDLIIMDYHLPGLNGIDTFEKIKSIRPDQKVVIFSSSTNPDEILGSEVIQHHAPICLFKPAELDEIREVLCETLGIAI